ncbi:MAG TPA: hypothetical protein VMD78_07315 [Candidatus Baltobacteraceae bacterium]|nr:hypothetical protein [Candidatus Baltobacteraceae bacterium]
MRFDRSFFRFAAALLLVALASIATRAQSLAPPADYDPNFNYDCDRACLNAYADQVLASFVAHDPSTLPLARQVKYTENGQALPLGEGLWGTASGIGNYKIYADDPETGEVMFMGTMLENGAPIIVNLRLKVEIRRITEIESTIARKEAGSLARPENLVTPNPLFAETVPPAERRSRANMIAIANSYFSAIEKGHASFVPFDKDCNRIESGVQTTNNPSLSNAPSSVFGLGCADQIKLRDFQPDTYLRDRRFLVVDEERGLVFVQGFFDHDARLRSFTLTDGRVVQQTRTAPWTWEFAELFKIKDGKIMRVEAIVDPAPYGMKSGW